jgi:hypothetical protein
MRTRLDRGLAPLLVVSFALMAPPAQADPPDGTELEFLWQVNLARSDPGAWARENGLGTLLDGIAPQPPLAGNATLVDSAQAKAQEFVDHGYFAHDSPVSGSPYNLIVNVFGYPLAGGPPFFYFGPGCSPCAYGSGNPGIESLAASGAADGGLFATPVGAVWGLLGEICDSAGTPNSCGTVAHRNHLLAAAALTAPMVESGAGHAVEVEAGPSGPVTTHYWVFHTGFPAGSEATLPHYLTGVVWADADQDGRFDAGEGLGGVTVQANALETQSHAGGGWSLAVEDGSYDVSCTGGGFAGTASAADVAVAGANRQVDCLSGRAAAVVDFVPEPGAATRAGSALAALALLGLRRARARRLRDRPATGLEEGA